MNDQKEEQNAACFIAPSSEGMLFQFDQSITQGRRRRRVSVVMIDLGPDKTGKTIQHGNTAHDLVSECLKWNL